MDKSVKMGGAVFMKLSRPDGPFIMLKLWFNKQVSISWKNTALWIGKEEIESLETKSDWCCIGEAQRHRDKDENRKR